MHGRITVIKLINLNACVCVRANRFVLQGATDAVRTVYIQVFCDVLLRLDDQLAYSPIPMTQPRGPYRNISVSGRPWAA